MNLLVKKVAETEICTLSSLYFLPKQSAPEWFSHIIEDGYNNPKIPGMTRIPDGGYIVKPRTYGRVFEKQKKYGFAFVPEITLVPGFSDILIHIGNTVSDTDGCLLPNYDVSYHGNNWMGSRSKDACTDLYTRLDAAWKQGEQVFITFNRLGWKL